MRHVLEFRLKPPSVVRWVAAAGAVLLAATVASADSIWVRTGEATTAQERKNIKIDRIENGVLHFRAGTAERADERKLDEVVRIAADGEPAFTQAEEAFAAGRWDQAAAAYQKAAGSTKQWVRDRSGVRLVAAAEKSGKFATAVTAWVTLMTRDAGLAARSKPQIPAGAKPGSLDSAVNDIDRALNDSKLTDDQRQTLLAFQMELARANGDAKKAQAIGTRLSRGGGGATSGSGGATGGAPVGGATTGVPTQRAGEPPAGPNPALALQLAFLALDQKQYQQAAKEINGAAVAITDPAQQVDALFVLAEASAGIARDDPAALKDAALAYMRVVARAKSAGVTGPRLSEALLKTAMLQERLKSTQEALLLYEQVAEEFKGTEAATRATQAADRLRKADKPADGGSDPAVRGS